MDNNKDVVVSSQGAFMAQKGDFWQENMNYNDQCIDDHLGEGWRAMGKWLCQTKANLYTQMGNTLQIFIHDSDQFIGDHLGEG